MVQKLDLAENTRYFQTVFIVGIENSKSVGMVAPPRLS
jgi:hypothetical protein